MNKIASFYEHEGFPIPVAAIDPYESELFWGEDKQTDDIRDTTGAKTVPDRSGIFRKDGRLCFSVTASAVEKRARDLDGQLTIDSPRLRRYVARVKASMQLGMEPEEMHQIFYGGRKLVDPFRLAALGFETEARWLHNGSQPIPTNLPTGDDVQFKEAWKEVNDNLGLLRGWGNDVGRQVQAMVPGEVEPQLWWALHRLRRTAVRSWYDNSIAKDSQEEAAQFYMNRIASLLEERQVTQATIDCTARRQARHAERYERPEPADWLVLADAQGTQYTDQSTVQPVPSSMPNNPMSGFKQGDEVYDKQGNRGRVNTVDPTGKFTVNYEGGPVADATYNANAVEQGLVVRSMREAFEANNLFDSDD